MEAGTDPAAHATPGGPDGMSRSTGRRPIRVALLAPTLDPGGAERQMLHLVSALPSSRFEVRFLILSEPGALSVEARGMGIPLDVLGLRRDRCRHLRPGCIPDAMRALRAYRSLTQRVDIVDAWTVPAYTFAGLARPVAPVPVLIAGRRSLPDVTRTRTPARELIRGVAMRQVDAVVANSRAAGRAAIELEGVDARRVHVIPNAVQPPVLDPAELGRLRQAWGFPPGSFVVGCVARLQEGKGHLQLLRLAESLQPSHPHVRYVFMGSGPLEVTLREAIDARGLRGVVVVHTGERDARPAYPAFDLVVQASVSEGMPNAVLEAAAAGRPIVATAVGGTAEVLEDGRSGLLVPPDDLEAMRLAMERIISDPTLAERLGAAAADRAAGFSRDSLAERTGALYERLLRDSGRPRQLRGRALGPVA